MKIKIENWPTVPLGEVLTERQEMPDPNALATGKIRIVSKIGFSGGLIQLRAEGETKTGMILIRPGDLVVSGINAAKGAISIYGEENSEPIAATIHYGAYIPNKDRVDVRFLWWLLRSGTFRELLLEYVPGGIKTELKAKRLLPIPVPLPDLPEQRRIVERIEQLAAQIEEARRLRHQATEEAEALGRSAPAMILKRLEKDGHPKTALASLVKILGGGTPSKHNYAFWDGNIPWVSPKDMKVSEVHDSEDHITQEAIAASAATQIPTNSVLVVVRSGILRRTVPVAINRVPVTINQDMKALVPCGRISPEYLRWWFKGKEPELLECVKGGTTVQSVVWEKVTTFDVCVPPLPEQRQIVGYLDGLAGQVAALARLQSETASALDALLPSVLDKAFKGEL